MMKSSTEQWEYVGVGRFKFRLDMRGHGVATEGATTLQAEELLEISAYCTCMYA
jgi:hypothetical protein